MAVELGGFQFTIQINAGNSRQVLRQIQTQLNQLVGRLGAVQPAANPLTESFKNLGKAMAAVGLATTALRFSRLIKESTLLAGRVEALGTVLQNVGQISGLNAAQINDLENSVKSLGITTRAARTSLSQLAQANLDLRESVKLTRIAQDAAVIAGIDSSEAFNRLVVSIQRNDVRLLRNLGIVINLNTVYQKFAQQTGRTVQSLTAFEKRNLLLNEVLQDGQCAIVSQLSN